MNEQHEAAEAQPEELPEELLDEVVGGAGLSFRMIDLTAS